MPERSMQERDMTKNRLKEISYCLFFGLMVFAKGIGLDSGNKAYYLLSAAACLCVGCKLVLTKYDKKQIAVMACLFLTAFLSYRNSGRMGIVLSVLALAGLKDMDLKKLFRIGLVIYSGSFAATVIMAGAGIINNPLAVHEKGGVEVIRWGMGYSTGNIFHVSYFMLTVFLCYTWGKRYSIKKMAGLMAGNLLVFLYSLSYTGAAVTAFYLLLNLYAAKRGKLSKAERVICQLPLPLCLLFSFGGPFLLKYPVMRKLDSMLQARLTFSAYYLQNQPVTLFGARMKDVPNFWVIMDNGYVYFFMTFGIVAFAFFCLGYAMLIAKYSGMADRSGRLLPHEKGEGGSVRLQELAIIFSFLLYGVMEQFISNAFMNLSLLFMGELLFGFHEKAEEDAVKKGKGLPEIGFIQWTCGAAAGIATAAMYFWAVPAEEYIKVPLDSVLYVDAQSVQMVIDNQDHTKESLKEAMHRCREQMEDIGAVREVIKRTGMEDKITVEELQAAMEFSIPIAVQSGRDYNIFRVRILELYCGIEEEEYRAMLEQAVMLLGEKEDGFTTAEEGIYEERIGKSFGTDRIEHIDDELGYTVEKDGSIAKVEHVRNGVFYGITAGIGGMALSVLFLVYAERRRNHENSN